MAWNGTLERVALMRDGRVIRIERRIKHPVDEVWNSITHPNRIAGWLARGKFELRKGGEITLDFENTNTQVRGQITRLKAPSLLEFTWATNDFGDLPEAARKAAESGGGTCGVDLAASRVRWQLSEAGKGATLFTLTHTLAAPGPAARSARGSVPQAAERPENVLAGWQTHLDGLTRLLTSGTARVKAEAAGFEWDAFGNLRDKYAAALG